MQPNRPSTPPGQTHESATSSVPGMSQYSPVVGKKSKSRSNTDGDDPEGADQTTNVNANVNMSIRQSINLFAANQPGRLSLEGLPPMRKQLHGTDQEVGADEEPIEEIAPDLSSTTQEVLEAVDVSPFFYQGGRTVEIEPQQQPGEGEGEQQLTTLPLVPTGQDLMLTFLSTWGDPHFVGLGAIQIFDSHGRKVVIPSAEENLFSCIIPVQREDVNELYYGVHNDEEVSSRVAQMMMGGSPTTKTEVGGEQINPQDPRQQLFPLIDPEHDDRTTDELAQWMMPFSKPALQRHVLCISLPEVTEISAIRFFNYCSSDRVHTLRGVRHLELTLDDMLVFRGEIRCGDTEDLLFSEDVRVLRHVAENLLEHHEKKISQAVPTPQHVSLRNVATQIIRQKEPIMSKINPATPEEQASAVPLTSLEFDISSIWDVEGLAIGVSGLRLYEMNSGILITTEQFKGVYLHTSPGLFATDPENAAKGWMDAMGIVNNRAVDNQLMTMVRGPPLLIKAGGSSATTTSSQPDEEDILVLAKIRVELKFPTAISRIELANCYTPMSHGNPVRAAMLRLQMQHNPTEYGEDTLLSERFDAHCGIKVFHVSVLPAGSEIFVRISPPEGIVLRISSSASTNLFYHVFPLEPTPSSLIGGDGKKGIQLSANAVQSSPSASATLHAKIAIKRAAQIERGPPFWLQYKQTYQTPILPAGYVFLVKFVAPVADVHAAGVTDAQLLRRFHLQMYDEDGEELLHNLHCKQEVVKTLSEEYTWLIWVIFDQPTAVSIIKYTDNLRRMSIDPTTNISLMPNRTMPVRHGNVVAGPPSTDGPPVSPDNSSLTVNATMPKPPVGGLSAATLERRDSVDSMHCEEADVLDINEMNKELVESGFTMLKVFVFIDNLQVFHWKTHWRQFTITFTYDESILEKHLCKISA